MINLSLYYWFTKKIVACDILLVFVTDTLHAPAVYGIYIRDFNVWDEQLKSGDYRMYEVTTTSYTGS